MQIFPYEIQRITGLSTDWLQQEWISLQVLQTLLEGFDMLENLQKQCIHSIELAHQQGNDYALKKRLKQLNNDFYNGRQPKYRKLERFLSGREENKSIKQLLGILQQYLIQKEKVQGLRKQFEGTFQEAWYSSAMQLQEISKDEDFLKSLLLSSQSLFRRCTNFWETPPESWVKKQRQTSISLLKYITRMSIKTSPYSRFTRLAIRHIPTGECIPSQDHIYLNTHLLPYFQEWLIGIPQFRSQMPIRINPSLERKGEEYRYILNSRNVESIQRVGIDELLLFLISHLSAQSIVFDEIVNVLLKEVEADTEELERYLLRLINLGVFEWEWPISALDSNWSYQLLQLIEQKSDFPGKESCIQMLFDLNNHCHILLDADVEQRAIILEQAFLQVQSLSTLLQYYQDTARTDEIDDQVFHRFHLTNLHLRPEQLFFEDATQAAINDMPTHELNTIIQELDQLVRAVCPLNVSELQPALLQFLQQSYPQGHSGALLDIYEDFFRFYLGERGLEEPEIEPSDEQKKWEDAVRRLARNGDREGVHIHLEDLVKVSEDLFPYAHLKGEWCGSALIQTFQEDQTWKAYIDTVHTGYGKLIGRFLPLFPENVSRKIQQWNLYWQGEQLWAENNDASSFNANVHPPLLKAEIRSPGSHQRLSKAHQIPVGELEVQFRPPAKIELRWEKRILSIFDLGFESWRSRSTMYRLLNCFGLEFPNWSWLQSRLGAIYRGEGERQDGHVRIPRISIGERLVVHRQTWIFQIGQFPVPYRGESDTDYYLRVQQWQRFNKLPSRGFLTILDRQTGRQRETKNSSDDYKPQYIDLQHPLMVQLLGRLTKRNVQQITFTEVLPSIPTDQKKKGGNKGVEKIIEWGGSP